MKQLLVGTCAALAMAACAGGAKKSTDPQPPAKSACAVAAEHTSAELLAVGADGLGEAEGPGLIRVITERCENDHWAAAAIECVTNARAMEEGSFQRCDDMLTEEQQNAAEEQLDREVMGPARERMREEEKAEEQAPGGEGAKPPPAPPDDPCGGGA
jgi:hypothetical protein